MIVVTTVGLYQWEQSRVIPDSLRAAGLDPIPREARDVRSAAFSNLFSSEARLRFQAPPPVIESWVRDSPALRRSSPSRFSPARQMLPREDEARVAATVGWEAAARQVYYFPPSLAPWYAPRISRGRRYELPWDSRQFHGEVLIDDAAGLVYVTVSRS